MNGVQHIWYILYIFFCQEKMSLMKKWMNGALAPPAPDVLKATVTKALFSVSVIVFRCCFLSILLWYYYKKFKSFQIFKLVCICEMPSWSGIMTYLWVITTELSQLIYIQYVPGNMLIVPVWLGLYGSYHIFLWIYVICGLMHKKRNSSVLVMELRLCLHEAIAMPIVQGLHAWYWDNHRIAAS